MRMRLNPFNTGNINVRSSGGGGVPGGKAGGLGCGTIVIAALGYFVFGLDPMQTAGMVESVQQGQQQAESKKSVALEEGSLWRRAVRHGWGGLKRRALLGAMKR